MGNDEDTIETQQTHALVRVKSSEWRAVKVFYLLAMNISPHTPFKFMCVQFVLVRADFTSASGIVGNV